MNTDTDYKSYPLDITGDYANKQYVLDTKAQCEVDSVQLRSDTHISESSAGRHVQKPIITDV